MSALLDHLRLQAEETRPRHFFDAFPRGTCVRDIVLNQCDARVYQYNNSHKLHVADGEYLPIF